jgi:DNA segregation ATPase FtsK/SpoIIIE, S-DNA-T family
LRPGVRDALATRLELRLGDPGDSAVNRRSALNVPADSPGRGLPQDTLHFLAGLPRIDGRQTADDLSDGVDAFVTAVRKLWPGPSAPEVRMLPEQLPYEILARPAVDHPNGVAIGIAESDLAPVYLDFAAETHLLLFGDVESGKSSFLRMLAHGISTRFTPREARIMVVDFRRSLLGAVEADHLIGYGSSAKVTEDLVGQVVPAMRERLPGPDVTPEQLRDRSWWKGPELYLLVDDYDLVASSMSNPLTPLLEFLPQARDIGLHLIVTRRTGGAGRALFDPIIARLREVSTGGIVMSGSKEEGVLMGSVKPHPLPPGRGWLVTRRGGTQLVQLAWLPPSL